MVTFNTDQDAHAYFVRACARAFAGTRWKPYRYEAHNEAAGSLHTIVLKLTLRDLLETLPDAEIFPRSCRVRDPRFTLRSRERHRPPSYDVRLRAEGPRGGGHRGVGVRLKR